MDAQLGKVTPSHGTEPTADPCLCFQNQLILGVMGTMWLLNDIKRVDSNYTVSVVPLCLPALLLWDRSVAQQRPMGTPTAPWSPLSSGSQGRLPEEMTLGLELEWAILL